MSSKSHSGRLLEGGEGDGLAGVERAAAAKGDDPVGPVAAQGLAAAGATSAPVGSLAISLNTAVSSPARAERGERVAASWRWPPGPRSVTSSGRAIPAARQASASSAMRPAPKRMRVG